MVAGLELLVSPVIESLISNLASTAFNGNNLFSDAKFELENFYKTLTNIQAVLCDAKKMQVENMLVQSWLRELKDVAYWAEEVVGEFHNEALRRRMETHGRMGKKIKNFFSLSNPVGFRLKMARKVKEINRMLDGITKGMESFKFVNLCSTSNGATSCKVNIERETSSHVNDSEAVLGRETDKSKVIGLLIDNSNSNQKIHYSVVRIVGMGGIGKTTLAQLVYADESVKEHFQIKMWVCVSIKSNTKEIFTDLLESSSGGVSNMDAIKNRLIERLKGKKYLIVLDDVWIDNKIDVEKLLKDLLSMGSEGSKILMTMRSDEDIPPKMGAKKTPNLVDIGLKIVRKCGGLPLAAKTLGGLLRSRSDEQEWSYILNSQIWNLPQSEDKIIGVIKLSYDRLSPSLKQCFSYCSIFPKNYNISKKKLIRLWMAEGFLISPSGESEVLEADEKRNQRGDIKSFKMHDLVHDLALSVVGTESSLVAADSTLQGNGLKCTEDTNRLRRVGLVLDLDISTTPLPIYKANKLRTLISFPSSHASKINGSIRDSMVSNWILLRVLDLREAAIQELPASICKMKHLRYLDLSSTYLEFFPSSFTKLYNLLTLRVKDCIRLTELPKDIRHLISLKYLIYSEGHQVTQMPRGLRKLSQLQELSTFVVGKGKGCGIEEMKDLNFLGGKHTISRLENVSNSIGANLKEKKDIRYLALHWGDTDDHNSVIENTHEYEMVFDGLQPHPYLKELVIKNFSGFKFPTWLGSTSIYLPHLVCVTLEKCDKCEHLPGLGRLQFLKFFTIERMVSLRRIGSEFYGSNEGAAMTTNTSFPSLIKLSFQCMDNLEEWLGDQSSSLVSCFPCLEELKIQGRSMLRIMPTLFPSLRLNLFVCS
ncbi:putative disease resistance protein RGA4 [Papaver somniferum]|uniref:putative disease resistance protein RGA4 n=1 Tax=Papaver somniferum TaxID=3469 RepID=UPI000E70202F|nr:putative disease resistance protein RGA4 [Papaver somniferum]